MNRAKKILVIEDDSGVALALYRSLSGTYKVDTAKTGSSGLRKADLKHFDVIILDLNLPDMSGLQICKRLRLNGFTAPIIVLTGETAITSKVSLLDSGASDYLTKPFSLEELKARLRALLRVEAPKEDAIKVVAGELTLDTVGQYVERAGKRIPLRRKEFAILECMMHNAGSVVTRNILMSYAWDRTDETWTNTVDVHIKHLRDKVDRPFTKPLIKTVHGLGYKLEVSKPVVKSMKGGMWHE